MYDFRNDFCCAICGPCNSFNCLGHFKNVYDDDDDDESTNITVRQSDRVTDGRTDVMLVA